MTRAARARRPSPVEPSPPLLAAVPGGLHEREADRAADQVLSPGSKSPDITSFTADVSRKPAANLGRAAPASRFVTALGAEAHRGVPLSDGALGYFEPRFGRDLGLVRVHDGSAADKLSRAAGARAFTHGQHIFLRSGERNATSGEGRRLLAHELAHTLQQGTAQQGTAGAVIQRQPAASAPAEKKPGSGGTLGGFFANIGRAIADVFGGEPDYSDDELAQYLKDLKRRDAIEDDFDSDNKARVIVAKKLNQKESLGINTLLMEELLSGAALDSDESAVLAILEFLSPAGRATVAGFVGLERLYDKFHGSELDRLYLLFPVLDQLHPRRGDTSTVHTMQEYIDHWAKENGVVMAPAEKKTLARGCIGITALEIGTLGDPDLTNCYESFAEAHAAQERQDAFLAANRPDRKAVIFSKRFYMENKPPKDEKSGTVDMSGYDYSPRPGDNMTNFDYGLYDELTGNWWHANHCDAATLAKPRCGGAMEVYESTLEHYSRPLADFNRQIFCVGVAVKR